ncbi:MAG: hypothetical protein ACK4L7_11185, partial [Flavobacteriales bacterium]
AADSAIVTVQLYNERNAGCDALVEVCSNAFPFILLNSLGCAPELGGLWFKPDGSPHTGIFSPATDPGGSYKYLLPGNPGCGPDSAFVTVQVYSAVDAGENGQVQVCSDSPPFQLFSQLQGSPQPGGTWFGPLGEVTSGTYVPGQSVPGLYKYKFFVQGPCPGDSATVAVSEVAAPNPGISSIAPLCSSQGPVALIGLLAGTPDGNGAWSFGIDPVSAIIDPANAAQGLYTYTLQGVSPCASASASVYVTIAQQAYAGTGGSITACEGSSSIALVNGLGGTVTPGGSWSNNCGLGALSGGVFDASGLSAGQSCTFTYAHAADGPCPATSATVTLAIVDALHAGEDSTVQVCRGALADLFALLGGDPQPGGYWLNDDNAPGFNAGGFFATGLVAGGTSWRFRYVLPALPQCLADTAQVTIQVLNGPNAGSGSTQTYCSNNPPVNLGTGLS